MPPAESRRSSSSSSPSLRNGSVWQGSTCLTYIPPIPHTPASSKKNTDNLFPLRNNSVLPQIALWGKGKMCLQASILLITHSKMFVAMLFQRNSSVVFFVADLYACAKHKKIKGSFTASLNPFNLNLNYEKNLPVLFAWHKDKDFFI